MHWLAVECLLHHLKVSQPVDHVAFPRLIAVLTSLRDLSELARSNLAQPLPPKDLSQSELLARLTSSGTMDTDQSETCIDININELALAKQNKQPETSLTPQITVQ